MTLQWIEGLGIVQDLEVPHQKQPRDARRLHAIDQRVRRQYLLDRPRNDVFFHVFTVER
ncbi:hypothetical protein D3C85_1889510 [compost metagenome]